MPMSYLKLSTATIMCLASLGSIRRAASITVFCFLVLLRPCVAAAECGKILYPDMLDLANKMTLMNRSMLPSGLVEWEFSGDVDSSLFHPSPSSRCATGRMATDAELSRNATAESILCTRPRGVKEGGRRTIVLAVRDEHHTWDDILSAEYFGLNLWHFHANFFPFWLSLKLVHMSRRASRNEENNNNISSTVINDGYEEPSNIVMLLPPTAWNRVDNVDDTPFIVSASVLRQQLKRGGYSAALVGLQGMADGLAGRMIVASQNTKLSQLHAVISQHGFSRPDTWLIPPRKEEFLWRIAQFEPETYPATVKHCPGSLVTEYISSLVHMDSRLSNSLARHVCVVSRQTRTRKGEPERFKLRNFQRGTFGKLILKLSSAVVLTPQVDINEDDESIPTDMSRASIKGQLRFVAEECAVLMGIHGAGLTNVLGLRAGTVIVEFQMEEKQYGFFKNLAAIMDDIDYVRIFANGTRFDSLFEGDFYFDGDEDGKVNDIVKMTRRLVQNSIRKQTWYMRNGAPTKAGLYDLVVKKAERT